MDPTLEEIVASICASMDRIGNSLLREAEANHAAAMQVGRALEALGAAQDELDAALRTEAA